MFEASCLCGFAAVFKSVVCVLVLLLSRFAELVCASVFCLGLRFAKKSDEKNKKAVLQSALKFDKRKRFKKAICQNQI